MNDRVSEKFKRDLQDMWVVRDSPIQLKVSIYHIYVHVSRQKLFQMCGSFLFLSHVIQMHMVIWYKFIMHQHMHIEYLFL